MKTHFYFEPYVYRRRDLKILANPCWIMTNVNINRIAQPLVRFAYWIEQWGMVNWNGFVKDLYLKLKCKCEWGKKNKI